MDSHGQWLVQGRVSTVEMSVCVYVCVFNKLRFPKPETIVSCYTFGVTSSNSYKYQILTPLLREYPILLILIFY